MLAVVAGADAPASSAGERIDAAGLRQRFISAATPKFSDAMHRGGAVIAGLQNMNPGKRLVGQAVTVVSFPGDWSCPVQAIDRCQPGDVLVIDAAGVGPAVGWSGDADGGLRQLGGVVIHGACRDIAEITR